MSKFFAAIHPKVGWAAFISLLTGILLYELSIRTGWHPGPGEVTAITGGIAALTGWSVPAPDTGAVPVQMDPAASAMTDPTPVPDTPPAPAAPAIA